MDRLLTEEEIKEQLLKSGFLVSYIENLLPEELVWWKGMCKAQSAKTRKAVAEEIKQGLEKDLLYIALEYNGIPSLHLQTNAKKSARKYQSFFERYGVK